MSGKLQTQIQKPFRVDGLAILDREGAIVYDLLSNKGEASAICNILNAGIGPDWEEVKQELIRRGRARARARRLR